MHQRDSAILARSEGPPEGRPKMQCVLVEPVGSIYTFVANQNRRTGRRIHLAERVSAQDLFQRKSRRFISTL